MKQKAPLHTRVNCGRVSGKVAHWQGEEGWIRPDAPIDHKFKTKNSGLLFVRRRDVSAGQVLEVGQVVDFLVYSEVSEGGRLGAEFCRAVPAKSQNHSLPNASKTPPVSNTVLKQNLKPTLMKPLPKKGGKPAAATLPGKGFGNNMEGFKVKGKLPRQQVSNAEQSGQLEVWMGKYGWIVPDEPVNHPAAAKKEGKVYVHLSDMDLEDDSIAIMPGSRVSFFVYVDSSGLGAQSCRIHHLPQGKQRFQSARQTPEKGLPPFWEEHHSEEYNVPYFWNSRTKESVWVRPES